jgi:hypothetical protein
LSLAAIEIEVVDTSGAGFTFLLGPPSAVDLIVQLIGALSAMEASQGARAFKKAK